MSKAARTRESIVKAAAAAIRAVGPDRVSVADVMIRLNLTHGGFYAHFASKDDLIIEAIAEAFRDINARRAVVTDGKAPAAALSDCIDWYVSSAMRDCPEQACPLTTLINDVTRLPTAAGLRMAEGALRMAGCIEMLLRNLGRPDPEIESLSVTSEMVGAVSLARTVLDKAKADQFLATTRSSLKTRLGLQHE